MLLLKFTRYFTHFIFRSSLIIFFSSLQLVHNLSSISIVLTDSIVIDMCELARNSCLQSGFEMEVKRHWLGHDWYKPGVEGNQIHKTNVPSLRVEYRHETLKTEIEMVGSFLLRRWGKSLTHFGYTRLLKERYHSLPVQNLNLNHRIYLQLRMLMLMQWELLLCNWEINCKSFVFTTNGN